MARSLIVCGLDKRDWNQEKYFMAKYGCTKFSELRVKRFYTVEYPWSAACFPSLQAAEACAADLQQQFDHLWVCVEPDWEAFGKSKATAAADLIWLAEWLGCRDQPRELPVPEAVCLERGATAILAAFNSVGGPPALALADPAAALSLCHGLMQDPAEAVHRRVEAEFALLAPKVLQAAAAEAGDDAFGFLRRVIAAGRLVAVFMRTWDLTKGGDEQLRRLVDSKIGALWQDMASHCCQLLHAVAGGLSKWSASVGGVVQRQEQRSRQNGPDTMEYPGELIRASTEAHFTSTWLPLAACSMLVCMQEQQLCSAVNKRQLLGTLGQLAHQVVTCLALEERATAAAFGVWPQGICLVAPACVGQLHLAAKATLSTMDMAARAAAGVPALHVAIVEALRGALDRLVVPWHLGVLLYLSLTAELTSSDSPSEAEVSNLMIQLVRLQKLAAMWLELSPQEIPADRLPVYLPGLDDLPSYTDQLALLIDINAFQLATAVNCVLSSPAININCIFETGAVDSLAAILQVVPCKSVRGCCGKLTQDDASSCLAPGLFHAAGALLKTMQCAKAASAEGRPWASDAIAALVRGGLGGFQLARAEAAAQEAPGPVAAGAAQPDPAKPQNMRRCAASILAGVTEDLTLPVARTLAERDLVDRLLQAMPWRPTSMEDAADTAAWQTTVLGTTAVSEILATVLAAEASVSADVLGNGSWDAAVRRVRDLQPPPSLAAEWPEQRETLLLKVSTVLDGSSGESHSTAGGSTSAADVAVAAVEPTARALLVEEQPKHAPGPRSSKKAAKRARRRARAAGADPDEQPSKTVARPAAASSRAGRAASSSHGSSQTASAARPEDRRVTQVSASTTRDSTRVANLQLQQQMAAAAARPTAESDWWRCPLTDKVMRDPVLIGSEGHSFERQALEQWLAANPGVDPITLQPLPPQRDSAIANHALRNLLQQLQLG